MDVYEEDLIAIGSKVLEMADRVKSMNLVCSGCQATWAFEDDGIRYVVKMTVDPEHRKAEHEPPQA